VDRAVGESNVTLLVSSMRQLSARIAALEEQILTLTLDVDSLKHRDEQITTALDK
jgi:hypothetical protein